MLIETLQAPRRHGAVNVLLNLQLAGSRCGWFREGLYGFGIGCRIAKYCKGVSWCCQGETRTGSSISLSLRRGGSPSTRPSRRPQGFHRCRTWTNWSMSPLCRLFQIPHVQCRRRPLRSLQFGHCTCPPGGTGRNCGNFGHFWQRDRHVLLGGLGSMCVSATASLKVDRVVSSDGHGLFVPASGQLQFGCAADIRPS